MPGGDDSLGAVHRRRRQSGNAATIPRVSRRARDGGGGSATGRRVNRQDRILSAENAIADGRGAEDRRGLRRRGSIRDGRARENSGSGAQDRERDSRAYLRQA